MAKKRNKTKSKIIYADFQERVLADVIDLILLITIGVVTNAVLFQNLSIDFSLEFPRNLYLTIKQFPQIETLLIIISLLFSSGFLSLYFLILWVCGDGQTIGKKIVGIKVVSRNHQHISYFRAILRFYISILSFGLFGLGYISAIFDKKNQTWHDKLADTYVIKE